MNHKAQKTGFTLIELLIVIAIIGILAALLFPVFAKVREKARQTACLSNARQMGVALQEYTVDNDDHFMTRHDNNAGDPTSSTVDPNPAHFETWYDWIQPYIKSYDVQRCPSFGGPYPIPNLAGPPNAPVVRNCKSTYLISDNIITSVGVVKAALANIPNTASTILVAESPSGSTYFVDAGTGYMRPTSNFIPTAVDILLCPGYSTTNVANGPGSMHFVEYAPNVIQIACGTTGGAPAITARVTCIAVDGHAKNVPMNNADDGGTTLDAQNLVHDPPGGYDGLYFTGPDGELTIPIP